MRGFKVGLEMWAWTEGVWTSPHGFYRLEFFGIYERPLGRLPVGNNEQGVNELFSQPVLCPNSSLVSSCQKQGAERFAIDCSAMSQGFEDVRWNE